MLRSHVTISRLFLGFLLILMLIACSSTPTPSPPGQSGMGLSITSGPCPSATVKPGDAVVWTNADKADHQVRGVRDGVVIFDSGVLRPGDTFTFVFVDAGQLVYTCSLDGKSAGTITVQP